MIQNERITLNPDIRSGKPCVRGTRITVYDVLSYLAGGMTIEEVIDDFPTLTREDVLACLSCAANRERYTTIIKPTSSTQGTTSTSPSST